MQQSSEEKGTNYEVEEYSIGTARFVYNLKDYSNQNDHLNESITDCHHSCYRPLQMFKYLLDLFVSRMFIKFKQNEMNQKLYQGLLLQS